MDAHTESSYSESGSSESGSGDDDGALLLGAPTEAFAVKSSCVKKVLDCNKDETDLFCCAEEDTDKEAIDRDPRSDGLSCTFENEETQYVSMGWNPGWGVGNWIGRASPLSPQSQVLVANVYFCLKRLPQGFLKAVASAVTHVARSSTELGISNVLNSRV